MSRFVKQSEVRHETFDWGEIGWRCAPAETGARQLVVMDVTLRPGQAHSFHRHPGQEEMIIVKSGVIEQWLERQREVLNVGDSVYIDAGVVHASFNDSSESAQLQVVLGPALGDGGYGIEDVAADQPWASLRGD